MLHYYILSMKKKILQRFYFQFTFTLIFFLSCQETIIRPEADSAKTTKSDDKIIIIDQKLNEWDITAAVEIYEMEPRKFVAGLGPGYIPPITEAVFIGPDNPNYPDDSEEFIMLGVNLRGIKRAYSLVAMSRHEIVDDVFLDQYVAVAY